MTNKETTGKSRESSAEENKNKEQKHEKESVNQQDKAANSQLEEDEEENPFGGLRSGKNFKKNLGCGG